VSTDPIPAVAGAAAAVVDVFVAPLYELGLILMGLDVFFYHSLSTAL
jgi:hypothetical protein